MTYIALIAAAGLLLLQWTGSIPLSSVGGPLVIGLVVLSAAIAVGLHEAWTERRRVLGWALNIVIVLVTTFFAAQFGGLVMVFLLAPLVDASSIAATGGLVMTAALLGQLTMTLFACWWVLRFVKRWR